MMRKAIGALTSVVLVAALGGTSVGVANAAEGTVSGITASVLTDGTAPFDAADGPGLDSGSSNGIVRANDSVLYEARVTFSDSGDSAITSTLPVGMEWDSTATASTVCNGPGGGTLADGNRILTCNITDDSGSVDEYTFKAWVYSIGNGATIAPTFQVEEYESTATELTVSAVPETESRTYSYGVYNVNNDGLPGFQIGLYVFLGASVVNQNVHGLEALPSEFTYSLAVPEGAVVTQTTTSIGGGTRTISQPGGPGTDVTITVSDARTDYKNPTYNAGLGGAPNDFAAVLWDTLFVWTPYDPTLPNGFITPISVQLKSFDPLGLSGQSNFGSDYAPGQDPALTCPQEGATLAGQQVYCSRFLVNRLVDLSVVGTIPGTFNDSSNAGDLLFGDKQPATEGDEKVLPGQSFTMTVGVLNEAISSQTTTNPYGCVAWDTQLLQLGGTARGIARTSTDLNAFIDNFGTALSDGEVTVEYSDQTFADDAARRDVECGIAGNGDPGWVGDPGLLPGGLESVSSIRVSSVQSLAPGAALGLVTPLRRTVDSESLTLEADSSLPWFWQYGTTQQTLVKSTYQGTGVSGGGGYVQAVSALVRSTVKWDALAAEPGEYSWLTVNPLVIGPVGVGIDSVASGVQVLATMNSVCAEPEQASLEELKASGVIIDYVLTPADIAGGGTDCSQGGTPATVVLTLGNQTVPGGSVGGDFHILVGGHQSDLPELSFKVIHSATTPNPSTHTATVVISSPTDTSAELVGDSLESGATTDRTSKASITVSGVDSFAADISAVTDSPGTVGPGESFQYISHWGSDKVSDGDKGIGTLVQLLPYNGDSRGTKGLGANPIRVTSAQAEQDGIESNIRIQYTLDPATSVANALIANLDASMGITWVDLPGDGVPPDGVTALRFITTDKMVALSTGSATINVVAPDTLNFGARLSMNLYGRTELIPGDSSSQISIDGKTILSLDSNLSTVSGTVFRDLGFNGNSTPGFEWDGIDTPASVVATRDINPDQTFTASINDAGEYSLADLPAGTYVLSLAGVTGWSNVQPNAVMVVEGGQALTNANVIVREDLDDTVLVPVTASVSQGRSVAIDVTKDAVLGFPKFPGSDYAVDGVGLDSLTTTTQGGTVQVETATINTEGQSAIKYTAPTDWPLTLATSFQDTFDYSFTNAAGAVATETVTVTVYQTAKANNFSVSVKSTGETQVTLPNTVQGDNVTISDSSATSGDLIVTYDDSAISVRAAHEWVGNEITHAAVVAYTITDSQGFESSANIDVTVVRPPILTGTGSTVVGVGKTGQVQVGVLNTQDWSEYEISPTVDGASLSGVGFDRVLSYIAGATATVDVIATDSLGQTGIGSYVFSVQQLPSATGGQAFVGLGGSHTFQAGPLTTGSIVGADILVGPIGPAAVTVNTAGEVVFEANGAAAGEYPFLVAFTDNLGQESLPVEYLVNVKDRLVVQGDLESKIPMGGTANFEVTLAGGNVQSATVVTDPSFGSATVSPGGKSVKFEAQDAPAGSYPFVVAYRDELDQETQVQFTVVVQAAPIGVGDSKTINVGGQATFALTVITSGKIATATVSTPPTAGTATVDVGGTVKFSAGDAQPATYPFTVTFVDDLGQSVDVEVTVIVKNSDPALTRQIVRYQGDSRYGTSLDLNSATMVDGSPVFVAAGASFPDALSVAPAVKLSGGSLVLSGQAAIDPAMMNLLVSKNPSMVYIIGGTNTLGKGVEKQLAERFGSAKVERIQGNDRYLTSAAVFRKFFAGQIVTTAFVASGTDFPDALTASAGGGALGAPVLLVNGKVDQILLPGMTSELHNHGVKDIVIVGGTNTVNAGIETKLKATFTSVDRKSGATRYATNLSVNQLLDERFPAVDLTAVWLADGRNFPDALSAAVPAGASNARLVLSSGKCIAPQVVSKITNSESKVTFVGIVGGHNSLAKPNIEDLAACQ